MKVASLIVKITSENLNIGYKKFGQSNIQIIICAKMELDLALIHVIDRYTHFFYKNTLIFAEPQYS